MIQLGGHTLQPPVRRKAYHLSFKWNISSYSECTVVFKFATALLKSTDHFWNRFYFKSSVYLVASKIFFFHQGRKDNDFKVQKWKGIKLDTVFLDKARQRGGRRKNMCKNDLLLVQNCG